MKIMIVDDDFAQRELLRGFLDNQGYPTLVAADGKNALELLQRESVSLVLLDHRMPEQMGDEVMAKIKAINPMVRVIMITAYGDVETAVRVMKLGADEFLEKPLNLSELLEKILHIEQQMARDEDVAAIEENLKEGPLPLKIVAESPPMKEVLSLAQRVAESPWSVLIQGETGTGKDLVARLVYLLSRRKDGPFIAVNCASIPEQLFESELFGHEKGAFTGAVNRRRGRFELADGGVLFLDEIGEIPMRLQPKLLRAIETNRISRVGSEGEIPVDVRLLSATNRDLKRLADAGRFRQDLYYRIKVFEIKIPPLHQHREDIPVLVDFFLERYGSRPMRFSPEALDALIKYPFPGNVRELEHVVQRTVTLTRGEIIRPVDLPDEIRYHQAATRGTLAEILETTEREILYSALEKKGWIQTQAADQLGISERVLRYKMAKYDIKKNNS